MKKRLGKSNVRTYSNSFFILSVISFIFLAYIIDGLVVGIFSKSEKFILAFDIFLILKNHYSVCANMNAHNCMYICYIFLYGRKCVLTV